MKQFDSKTYTLPMYHTKRMASKMQCIQGTQWKCWGVAFKSWADVCPRQRAGGQTKVILEVCWNIKFTLDPACSLSLTISWCGLKIVSPYFCSCQYLSSVPCASLDKRCLVFVEVHWQNRLCQGWNKINQWKCQFGALNLELLISQCSPDTSYSLANPYCDTDFCSEVLCVYVH